MPLATAAVCSSQLRLTRTTCSSSRSIQSRCPSACRTTHARLTHRPSSLYGSATPAGPGARRSLRRHAATQHGPSDSGRPDDSKGPFGEEVGAIQDTEDQRLELMDQVVEEANSQGEDAPRVPGDNSIHTPKKKAPPVARTTGATLGTAALTTLGAAAGPVGAAVGATVGATVGGAIMDALVGSEDKKEQYEKGVEELGLRVKEATEQLAGNVEGAATAAADRAEHAGRGEADHGTGSPAGGTQGASGDKGVTGATSATSANSYESEVSQPGNKQAGLQQGVPTPATGTASSGGNVSASAKADQPTSAAGYGQELDTNQLSPAAGKQMGQGEAAVKGGTGTPSTTQSSSSTTEAGQQGPKGSIPNPVGDDSGMMTGGGFASGAGVTRGDELGALKDLPNNVNVLSSADAGYYAYRSRPEIRAEATSVEDAVAEAGWGDEGKGWEWGEAEKAQKELELVPAAEQGGAGSGGGRGTGGEEESAEQLLGKARGVPASAEATTAAVTDRVAESAAGGDKGDTMDMGDLAAKRSGGGDASKGGSSGADAEGANASSGVDQSSGNMVQTGESVAEKVAEEFGVGAQASDGVAEADTYQREAQDDKA